MWVLRRWRYLILKKMKLPNGKVVDILSSVFGGNREMVAG